MKFHDVEQNSDKWLRLRCGKITSSQLGNIMANFGKAFGEPAKKYAVDICIERLTGKSVSNGFYNEHMRRGHQQEPLARMRYEENTFSDVTNGGFFEEGNYGCSPDGLVGSEGQIEIKSVISSMHFKNVNRQKFDPAYKWQIIGNLFITGRDWIDFVSFCEDYPEEKQLFVHRTNRISVEEEIDQIKTRLNEFDMLIEETMAKIDSHEYFLQGAC